MKLKQITDKSPTTVLVEFEHETGTITKSLSSPLKLGSLLYTARDAERDISYRMFGDDWAKNCGRYWGGPDEREMEILRDAVKMRPDLFEES